MPRKDEEEILDILNEYGIAEPRWKKRLMKLGILVIIGLVSFSAYKIYYEYIYVFPASKLNPVSTKLTKATIYDVRIPRGVWVDTGLWVRPGEGFMVGTAEEHLPFEISFFGQTYEADLQKSDVFGAGFYLGGGVEKEQKIYLRAQTDAKTPQQLIELTIGDVGSNERDAKKRSSPMQIITSIILVILVMVGSMLYGHWEDKRIEKDPIRKAARDRQSEAIAAFFRKLFRLKENKKSRAEKNG